jgi:hypothetical protein
MEHLSWNEVNQLMPIGKTVDVTDPISNIRWKMKRTYGKLHADMEPLTQSDTNAIKKAFGFGTNYKDAPYHKVIITIDGRDIVGSLMTFAHQGSDKHKPEELVDPNLLSGYSTSKSNDSIHTDKEVLPNWNYIQDNGVEGHMCLYFPGSASHYTKLPVKDIDDVMKESRFSLLSFEEFLNKS